MHKVYVHKEKCVKTLYAMIFLTRNIGGLANYRIFCTISENSLSMALQNLQNLYDIDLLPNMKTLMAFKKPLMNYDYLWTNK